MTLRHHAASLTVMHAADVLQPLLILPYAARVLGAQQFGQFAYVMAIGQFAATIVEYGFHWTAQRAAAAARHEPQVIATLFADVLITKLMLCIPITIIGIIAAPAMLAISPGMFLCGMLSAVGGIVFPAWLLIGLEQARQAAIAVVTGRVFAIVAFVVAVHSPDDVAMAIASQSAVSLVAGVVSLPFIRRLGISWLTFGRAGEVLRQLRLGRSGFFYSLVERMLTTLPTLFIQHYGGYVAAGHYSVAEKFISGTRPFFRILSDTLLPRIAFNARHDPASGIRIVWLSLSSLVVGLGFSLALLIVAPMIIVPIFGESFAGAIPIVRWLAVVPLLINISACASNLFMFNYGYERQWSILNLVSLLLFVTAAYMLLLIRPDPVTAVSLAIVAREGLVSIVSASFLIAYTLCAIRKPVAAPDVIPAGRLAARKTLPALLQAFRSPPVA